MDRLLELTAKFDLVNSTTDQLTITAILTLAWALLFLVVNNLVQLKGLTVKQSDDTKNRIVSIVHGLLTFVLSLWVFTYDSDSFSVEYFCD